MDKIIMKYFEGDITLEDQHRLNKWLEEDETHPVILEQMEKYWRQGDLNFPEQKARVHDRVIAAMADLPKARVNKKTTLISFGSILKYAAVILMASLLSVYLYTAYGPSGEVQAVNYIEKSTEAGQKVTTRLPDGTEVRLNADSRLRFPESFSGDLREVNLEGEAFFEVAHNPIKPFIVHFGDRQVRVLGTSFNVNAYPGEEKSSVAVKSGKVAVKRGDEKVKLTPNELVVLNSSSLDVRKIEDADQYFGWVDNQLNFNKVTLEEAMEVISKWYGISYEILAQDISDSPYTAKHKDPNLKEVMMSLTFSYGLEYELKDKKIIIR